MLAKSAGGLPPLGQDMNGVLGDISSHTVFQNCGGRYRFDAALATAIGGYPLGFVLQDDYGINEYVSAIAANSGNFNTDPSLVGVTWIPYAGNGLMNPKVISGAYVQGWMWGGNIDRTSEHVLTISPCSCLDDTMTRQLYYNANFSLTIPSVTGTYHIYIVRLIADGSFTWRAYTTEVAASADAEVSHRRWRTFWNVESDGNLCKGALRKDILAYGGKLTSVTPGAGFIYLAADAGLLVATYSLYGSGAGGAARTDYPDISGIVPLSRVSELIPYNRGWMTSGVNGYAVCGVRDCINGAMGVGGFGYGGLMIGTQLISLVSAYYETTMNSSVYIKEMRILC